MASLVATELRTEQGLPYGLVQVITKNGERLPVLIDRRSGIPPRISLRYSLEERDHGSSSRLALRLRRIGALHNWYAVTGQDLDEALRHGQRPRVQHLKRALADFRRGKLFDKRSDQQAAPPTVNGCITAWIDFIVFAVNSEHWQSGDHPLETDYQRQHRLDYNAEIRDVLSSLAVPESPSQSHRPFSEAELAAIEEALFNPELHCFADACIERNRLVYRLLRHTGIRISEALKVKLEDLPKAESRGERLERLLLQKPRAMRIVRRPDDPNDPRLREARVKRGDRSIEIPDDLADDLEAYARNRPGNASQYLFVSSRDPSSPLSLSRCDAIAERIGKIASKVSPKNAAIKFNWHRLRTTRVVESLPTFFPDKIESEARIADFLRYFGWKDPASADPYLKTVRQQRRFARALAATTETTR